MNEDRYPLLLVILSSLCILVLTHTFFGVYRVYGSSMEPILQEGRNVVVLKYAPFESIHRGDIIVYKSPIDNRPAIKRCLAIAGDFYHRNEKEIVIPQGMLAAIGDNRSRSIDSRHYGAIDKELLIGKVIFPLPGGGFEE